MMWLGGSFIYYSIMDIEKLTILAVPIIALGAWIFWLNLKQLMVSKNDKI